jgi:hypothetical protein
MAIDAPPQHLEYAVLHDARAVHDTASLHFKDLELHGVPSWVLAIVTPSSRSGAATIPGAYIKADTGELVTPPNGDTVVVKEGTWQVVAAARRANQSTGNQYSWTEPLQRKRNLLPEDYYSPFIHGGTIVCRPEANPNTLAEFEPVRLLFSDWARYVVPTFAFAERQAKLFEEGTLAPADLPQLDSLLTQDNKLLAALALRTLMLSGRMTRSILNGQLARADGQLLAIITYLILTSPGVQNGNLWLQELSNAAQTARNVENLRPAALGAFAAGLFRSRDAVILTNSKSLLRTIRQRLGVLRVAIETEPDLHLMLEKMDIQ